MIAAGQGRAWSARLHRAQNVCSAGVSRRLRAPGRERRSMLVRELGDVHHRGEEGDDGEPRPDAEQRGEDRQPHGEHRSEGEEQDDHGRQQTDRLTLGLGALLEHRPAEFHLHIGGVGPGHDLAHVGRERGRDIVAAQIEDDLGVGHGAVGRDKPTATRIGRGVHLHHMGKVADLGDNGVNDRRDLGSIDPTCGRRVDELAGVAATGEPLAQEAEGPVRLALRQREALEQVAASGLRGDVDADEEEDPDDHDDASAAVTGGSESGEHGARLTTGCATDAEVRSPTPRARGRRRCGAHEPRGAQCTGRQRALSPHLHCARGRAPARSPRGRARWSGTRSPRSRPPRCASAPRPSRRACAR